MQKSSAKSFYLWIMLGLVVWGGLLAVGAFLGPEFWTPAQVAETGDGEPVQTLARPFDVRKPLIVLTFIGIFLGGWALAIRGRQKRLEKSAKEAAERDLAARALSAKVRH